MSKRDRRPTSRKVHAVETLPVALAPEELQAKATIAARKMAEREQVLEERQTALAGFKERVSALDTEVRELMRHVREGAVDQEVRVEHTMDWKSNSVVTVRLDTGEEVRRRAMTPEERQGNLFRFDDDAAGEGGGE